MDTGYPMVTKALNKTGRPIVFSCSWPAYQSSTRTVRVFVNNNNNTNIYLYRINPVSVIYTGIRGGPIIRVHK